MKKTLVAIAALANVSAFAQVTITGLVDMGMNRTDFKGNVVTTSAAPNGSATSNFTFLVTEDLGGGMKANARWEIDPDLTQTVGKTSGTPATGTTSNVTSFLGNGYSFLGLSGGFGNVQVGTINYATLSANGEGNQGLGTAIGSGYRVSTFDAVRAQNSLRYDTPVMNGFSASYLVSDKNDKQVANASAAGLTGNLVNQTQGRDKASEFALLYANGPITARYAALQTEQWGRIATVYTTTSSIFTPSTWTAGTGAAFKLNTLSVKYDVNEAVSVSYFNQTAKSDALIVSSSNAASTQVFDRKTNGFAASYTTGPTKFLVNYQNVTNGDAATSAAAASTSGLSAKVLGLGADYSISKRTVFYGRYEKDTDSTGAFRATTGYTPATNNTTYTAMALGIRHTF